MLTVLALRCYARIHVFRPFSSDNPQQLERKRHLGNDICNIIFQEDATTAFETDQYHSKYTHIFAVVSPVPDAKFRLQVFTKNTVPEYGPPLPNPSVFNTLAELRQFLIVKLLNGEKATLASPVSSFAKKKERTLEALIFNIHEKYDRKRTLGRGTPKVHGRQRVEAFRSKGQSIKMNKIAEGTAPTSMRNMYMEQGLEPWTPICITSSLGKNVVAGDSWGNDFIGSSAFGVTVFSVEKHDEGELESRVLIDSSVAIVALNIDEESDMLFCMSAASIDEKNDPKNGQVRQRRVPLDHVSRVSQLHTIPHASCKILWHLYEGLVPGVRFCRMLIVFAILCFAQSRLQVYAIPLDILMHRESPHTRKDLKKFIVAGSKGASLYSIHSGSTSTASILSKACKLVVAVGRKIKTYQFIPKNPARVPGMGTGGSFVQLHEYPCADTIESVTLGEPTSGKSGQLVCCALQSGSFALVNIETGEEIPLTLVRQLRPFFLGLFLAYFSALCLSTQAVR